MSEIIVVNHRIDFPAAQQLQVRHEGAELLFFDPQLMEHARWTGLKGVRLHRWQGNDLCWKVFRPLREEAAQLQQQIDRALATFVPEAAGCQWHYLGLFYLLYTLRGYRAIGDAFAAQAAQASVSRVHLLGPQQAFRYGQHSFAPALSLMQALLQAGKPAQFYAYELPGPDEDRVP
ncbi:MAG TPA: hypothetical protein VK195_19195, partial [Burkholderiaceae bacterium]|nr:hypothetical protein [Burkholderiaceae bacterium]